SDGNDGCQLRSCESLARTSFKRNIACLDHRAKLVQLAVEEPPELVRAAANRRDAELGQTDLDGVGRQSLLQVAIELVADRRIQPLGRSHAVPPQDIEA